MQYKPKSLGALHIALGGLPGYMPIEVEPGISVSAKTVLVASSCLANQRPDLANTYRLASDKVADLAIISNRAVGVSDQAYAAQASLYTEAMMKSMAGNCTNIAVLLQRYSNFCWKLVRQGTDPRIVEWIDCAQRKQQTCGGPDLP
jgi:hypothetical protein